MSKPVLDHEHTWSEWRDDKPMNIESQDKLIILSVRECLDENCGATQPRIGKVNPTPNSKKEKGAK